MINLALVKARADEAEIRILRERAERAEAAAEVDHQQIAALTKERDRAKAMHQHVVEAQHDAYVLYEAAIKDRDAHAKDAEALREALRKIAKRTCPCQPVGDCLAIVDEAQTDLRCSTCIAKAALGASSAAGELK